MTEVKIVNKIKWFKDILSKVQQVVALCRARVIFRA